MPFHRSIFAACIAVAMACAPASAQSPATPSNNAHKLPSWSRVVQLDPGTEIRVRFGSVPLGNPSHKASTSHVNCSFVAATDDELTCTRTRTFFFFPVHTTMRFPRSGITTVRLGRESFSSFVGGLIGIAGAAGITAILIAASGETNHEDDALAYGALGGLGYAIGSSIGRATDLTGGPTLYVAP